MIMIAALDVRDRHVKIEVVSVTATYYRCYLSTKHLDEKSIMISINEMPKYKSSLCDKFGLGFYLTPALSESNAFSWSRLSA